jgi:tetratricopeptide (TPR) repeat protein
MSIRNQDVISWTALRDEAAKMRIGFMSQVSPDGRFVVTTVSGAGKEIPNNYYVANFKDYHFLQVFYPTRGILAWYDRATGQRHNLPGADDPRYVQTGGFWSPDGKYLVFARAAAEDPYPEGWRMPDHANSPDETQIQYDLYRIPFNNGEGGQPQPIAGASGNGMSNNFPKISPDGKWIVFVKCRNGQLMRPDSQLYIVPATGGQARRMRCNTPLMNSWHSFSPNGRWLVFSSKSRSPYTQMYLTHLDEAGNDSPAILIENATAANRAVNIPEFLNIPPDGLAKIDVPAAEFYRVFDQAVDLAAKGQDEAAIATWKQALDLDPDDAKAQYNLGTTLLRKGRLDEAITHLQEAVEAKPEFGDAQNHLGGALLRSGKLDDAITHFQAAVDVDPSSGDAQNNLGGALLEKGSADEAIPHLQRAAELNPRSADTQTNLGIALLQKGKIDEAMPHLQKAVALDPRQVRNQYYLGDAFYLQGKASEALAHWSEGLHLDANYLPLLSQMAWLLATSPEGSVRNGNEAVELAQRAVQLSEGEDPVVLDTLGAAYAEAGRFADALETARRALDLATQQNIGPLAGTLRRRIALYEARIPYREKR